MSLSPGSAIDHGVIEQARKQINRLISELARLSASSLPSAEFYREFLARIQPALSAKAAAIWAFESEHRLQLQARVQFDQIGVTRDEKSRRLHDELLRRVLAKDQPTIVLPRSAVEGGQEDARAGNPTDYTLLLAPFHLIDKELAGLIEVWVDPQRDSRATKAYLQFLVVASNLATSYVRHERLRLLSGQQPARPPGAVHIREGRADAFEIVYCVPEEQSLLVDGCLITYHSFYRSFLDCEVQQ